MPVASSTTWHKFFWVFASRWHDITDTTGTSHSEPVANTGNPNLKATAAARAMFGEQLVESMNLEASEVHFHQHAIQFVHGRAKNVDVNVMWQITWEMAELNWCYELMALDRVLARELWCGEEASSARMEAVTSVFKPNCTLVWWNGDFPTEVPCITNHDISHRLLALQPLRRLMIGWGECPADIKATMVTRALDRSNAAALAFEQRILCYYCQTFFEHFGRPPVIPLTMPQP